MSQAAGMGVGGAGGAAGSGGSGGFGGGGAAGSALGASAPKPSAGGGGAAAAPAASSNGGQVSPPVPSASASDGGSNAQQVSAPVQQSSASSSEGGGDLLFFRFGLAPFFFRVLRSEGPSHHGSGAQSMGDPSHPGVPHSSHSRPLSSCQTRTLWPLNFLPQCRHQCSWFKSGHSQLRLCERSKFNFLLKGKET